MVSSPRIDVKCLRTYLNGDGLHHNFSTGDTPSCIPSKGACSSPFSVIKILLFLILPFEPMLIVPHVFRALTREACWPLCGPRTIGSVMRVDSSLPSACRSGWTVEWQVRSGIG